MRILRGLPLLLLLAPAACASARPAGAPSHHPSGPGRPSTARTIQLRAGDDGRTVRATVGDGIVLRLSSTYWTIEPAAPASVVATVGHRTHAATGRSCVPGQGCGTVSARFRAVHQGRATISAHRTSCGEALHCTPAQARYRVTVVVGVA